MLRDFIILSLYCIGIVILASFTLDAIILLLNWR